MPDFAHRTRPRIALGATIAAAGLAGAATGLAPATAAARPANPAATATTASTYQVHRQVADTASAHAGLTDPQLVNPWGLAQAPAGPVWVTNNGTSTATAYSGGSVPTKEFSVSVAGEDPSGEVYNPTSAFRVGTPKSPALFLFDSETGKLSGWAGGTSTVVATSVKRAVFKGLAMAIVAGKPRLFATDFHHGRIDLFNGSFRRLTVRGFHDARIPKGYGPFGIAALRGRLYVSYAKQDPDRHDDVAGPGHGYVDVYSTTGKLVKRLVRRHALNSPWGLAIAPGGFGSFAHDLLVGNFGNGQINAYNPKTGAHLGTLQGGNHKPLVLLGLWGLLPGNGQSAPAGSVEFSAGPGGEAHGLFGYLTSR